MIESTPSPWDSGSRIEIMVGYWKIKLDGSPLVESLGAYSGAKGDSFCDILGGELEVEELGGNGTVVYPLVRCKVEK